MLCDFYLGQIVVSDFSGKERQMFDMGPDGPERNHEIDNLLNIKDSSMVIDVCDEGNKGCVWIKLLTSSGNIGYVPSIWIKKI